MRELYFPGPRTLGLVIFLALPLKYKQKDIYKQKVQELEHG